MATDVYPEKRTAVGSNALIDVLKFVFAVFVAALHSGVDIGFMFPMFRLAVPFFFICSGYFLFSKVSSCNTEREQKAVLYGFVKRNLKLYLFWFILWLPHLLQTREDWFASNLFVNILMFLRSILFGSTFTASWYMAATIIDCCLVFWFSQKLNTKQLLLFGAIAYMGCLAFSNYYGLIQDCLLLRYCFTGFITLFNSVVTGFPAGLLWIAMGKFFAENQFDANKKHVLLLTAGFCGMLVEWQIVTRMGWVLVNDCFIMLIPTSYGLFQIVRSLSLKWSFSVKLRNMSTIIYAAHGGILGTITAFVIGLNEQFFADTGLWRFVITISACILLGVLIFGLEKLKPLRWVRYAH